MSDSDTSTNIHVKDITVTNSPLTDDMPESDMSESDDIKGIIVLNNNVKNSLTDKPVVSNNLLNQDNSSSDLSTILNEGDPCIYYYDYNTIGNNIIKRELIEHILIICKINKNV